MHSLLNDILDNDEQKIRFKLMNSDANAIIKQLSEPVDHERFVGHTVFQALLQQQYFGILTVLADKLSGDSVAELLRSQNHYGTYSFLMACYYQKDSQGMLAIIEKLSDQALVEFACCEDSQHWNGLMMMALHQEDQVVQAALQRLSNEVLAKTLHKKNDQNQSTLQAFLMRTNPMLCAELFAKCSQEVLAKAIAIKSEFYANGMHFAAGCLDPQNFQLLLEYIPKEVWQPLITQLDENQNSFLHIVMERMPSDLVLQLIGSLSAAELAQALRISRSDNITVYFQAIVFQDERVMAYCHDHLTDEQLEQLLLMSSKDLRSPLAMLFNKMPDYICEAVVGRLSDNVLQKVMSFIDSANESPLHYAVFGRQTEFVWQLLQRLDEATINKVAALRITNEHYKNWTLFNLLAYFHSPDCMDLLIDKTNDDNLKRVIRGHCENSFALGWNLLHHFFLYQPYEICQKLLKRLSEQSIIEALCHANAQNIYPLTFALQPMPVEFIADLVQLIPQEKLERMLKLTINVDPNKGMTMIHLAIELTNEMVIRALLDNLSENALIQIFTKQAESPSYKGYYPLMLAAELQSPETFRYLLSKISDEALYRVLPLTNLTHYNLLHIAAQSQSKEAFLELVARTPDVLLNQLMIQASSYEGSYGWTPLLTTVRNQPSEVVQQVVARIDDEHLDAALRIFTEKHLSILHVLLVMHDYPTIVSVVKRMYSDTLTYIQQNAGYDLHHAILENVNISSEERQELIAVLAK